MVWVVFECPPAYLEQVSFPLHALAVWLNPWHLKQCVGTGMYGPVLYRVNPIDTWSGFHRDWNIENERCGIYHFDFLHAVHSDCFEAIRVLHDLFQTHGEAPMLKKCKNCVLLVLKASAKIVFCVFIQSDVNHVNLVVFFSFYPFLTWIGICPRFFLDEQPRHAVVFYDIFVPP